MKTKSNQKKKNQLKGLQSQSEILLSSTNTSTSTAQPHAAPAEQQPKPARVLPFVNFAERAANRALPAERVVELLQKYVPHAYQCAEVVGTWVWITYAVAPEESERAWLSQLGFHWNNKRQCWQHPCGQQEIHRGQLDPRVKYERHCPATEAEHAASVPIYNGPPRTAEQVAA
jgi:hypothetical protein